MKKLVLLFYTTIRLLYAREYVYQNTTDGRVEEMCISVLEDRVHYSSGKAEAFLTYDNGQVNSYTFRDPISGSEGSFRVKDGMVISADGTVVEDINLKKDLWMQGVELASDFILSKEKELFFFIVGPSYDKRGNLISDELSKMELYLEKKKDEVKVINGVEVPCIKVLYTTKNSFMSLFWRNNLWYRKSDGVFVAGEVWNGGPGSPKTIIELVKEF